MRVVLFTRAPDDHILLLAMHHIVTDMWSLALMMYEMDLLYQAERSGRPASLKPLRAQYADHVRRQAEMLSGPEGERLWAFWRDALAGELPALDLPTDRPRPPTLSGRGSLRSLRLGADLTQALKALARAHGTTLYTTLLAAFQVLLHRYTGQDDILVGSPKAGRTRRMARVVGYFINPVVLRANVSDNPTFSRFLKQMHQTVQDAFAHDTYPFPLLVERLQPERDPSRSPLFQAAFAWQKTTRLVDGQGMASMVLGQRGSLTLSSAPLEAVPLEQRATPFDLTLLIAETERELGAAMEYSTDLFDGATIERMLGHYRTLLEAIVADPDRPIAELPLLTPAERHQLLVQWNDTAVEMPLDQPV
ncbi:MAG: non-ribosomal peptide synthetase, partial [Chloroflexi bacterium]